MDNHGGTQCMILNDRLCIKPIRIAKRGKVGFVSYRKGKKPIRA